VPQFGLAGYRIDLAIKHPGKAGIFLCSLECDGASYSVPTLCMNATVCVKFVGKLGRKIIEIWPTDWFRTQHPNE
jgi:hypothetical protein